MIFIAPPADFVSRFEVVSCYVEDGDKVLFLRRHPTKSEGDKWGIPAGKVDDGEDLKVAMSRELLEETGIDVSTATLEYLLPVYIRYPDYDYTYHMFRARPTSTTDVTISPSEHIAFQWTTVPDALSLGDKLVMDEDACIKLIYG